MEGLELLREGRVQWSEKHCVVMTEHRESKGRNFGCGRSAKSFETLRDLHRNLELGCKMGMGGWQESASCSCELGMDGELADREAKVEGNWELMQSI